MHKKKIVLILAVALAVTVFFTFDLQQYLTLDYFKSKQADFNAYYHANKLTTIAIFFVLYVLMAALSIPGAVIMTLLAGALFGTWLGVLVVSFASTIGATLAFLMSRFLLKDWVQNKFGSNLSAINKGIEKEGALYLFSMRLIPLFPFFVVNLVMGLTHIKTRTFFIASQLGMLAGTFVYVNAGTQLASIQSLSGIASPKILGSFVLLGLFPLIAKKIMAIFKSRQVYKGFTKPKQFDANMVVIGAGAAGLVNSYIAAAVKAKVILIEKHKMGGDCLNYGCVPSKALIRSAKFVKHAERAQEFGMDNANVNFEFKNIMNRVERVVKAIEPHDSVARYEGMGVECIQGDAKIVSPWEVSVNGRTITTKNIIIASGAAPFVPPIKGLDTITHYTSDTLWGIEELPKRLVVLGGGPIGCELTQSFARLGSEVTQVEMMDRIMGREDEDVSETVTDKFKAEGVNVLTQHKAVEFIKEGNTQTLVCENAQGETIHIEFDAILVAVGRKARVEGFGLEELGVRLSNRNTVEVNEYLQTNFPNIYAAGDVAGPYQFTHTAAHMAWYTSVNALFGFLKKFKVDYSVIPWATFTEPEVARVGLSEQDAKAQGIEYDVTKYNIDDLDRAIADEEAHGFVKVLTKPKTDKILGVTIVGEHAGDLIAEFVLAMKHGLGLNKILGTIHIYPTLAESNKYVAGEWKRANTSPKILTYLEKLHAFTRR